MYTASTHVQFRGADNAGWTTDKRMVKDLIGLGFFMKSQRVGVIS